VDLCPRAEVMDGCLPIVRVSRLHRVTGFFFDCGKVASSKTSPAASKRIGSTKFGNPVVRAPRRSPDR